MNEDTKMSVIEEVAAERRRQVEVEGWTPEHDDQHSGGELAHAAACYALGRTELRLEGVTTHFWPWDRSWWKPSNSRRDRIKAAALLIAEIERLDRLGYEHWDHRYRRLEMGEIIRATDECLTDTHLGWQPVMHTVGQAAPDPAYTSHRWYRRLKTEDQS